MATRTSPHTAYALCRCRATVIDDSIEQPPFADTFMLFVYAYINDAYVYTTSQCTRTRMRDHARASWWVTFRVIDEGSWGSRAQVLSILDLLASGVFTPERIAEIRKALD